MGTTVAECLTGWCPCENAGECKFERCENCDYPVRDGKTLVDHACEERDWCPSCGGPLNDRRINGPLVD